MGTIKTYPVHYREEIERQIHSMLDQGIIEESSSLWMAQAMFVKKSSGEIRLCVDYCELNKKTVKHSYPLPLPDEVQDRLAGSTIFSTLDLQSGYWQLPVAPEDYAKTAFCPGPGMSLFQLPFGLTGAPSSFQQLMDKIFRGLPFVTTYLDDILIHSTNIAAHEEHLCQFFHRIQNAGLNLRGRKCHIGMHKVSYLGHIFSSSGMAPNRQKVQAVHDWPVPTDVTAVHRFLGLASYYRHYISNFASIASPLHHLTQKGVSFSWTLECQQAFCSLKEKLVQAYPPFDSNADLFTLQTDASDVGLGAVLEQGGHLIAYASRLLTKAA